MNFIPDQPRPGLTTTASPIVSPQGGVEKLATVGTDRIKVARREVVIGTWNVRTLNGWGKLDVLTNELSRYRWDVIGLSETRIKNFGETTSQEGHKLYFSGHDSYHIQGVGFLVNSKRVNSVISCTPVSSRIIRLQLAADPCNISIVQAYAPTADCEAEVIESFYSELEGCLRDVSRRDVLVVMGDWNAKIGVDCYADWRGTVGKFGVGTTNDRGLRLLEFAHTHDLTIANTLHHHKLSRRTTWHSPDGITHNQIDYILTSKRFKSSINAAKTRTYPGADIGSDHDLVLMAYKLRLRTSKKSGTQRLSYDLDKLNDPNICHTLQARIGGYYAPLSVLDQDINTMTHDMETALHSAASEVLGPKRPKRKPWMTAELLQKCDRRRELRAHRNSDPEAYRQANRSVKQAIRTAKESWVNQLCNQVESDLQRGNSKSAYKAIKTLTTTRQPKNNAIEDASGNLVVAPEAISQRWTDYCKELYNFPIQPDRTFIEGASVPNRESSIDSPFLEAEVVQAIKQLKNGKAPGIDNIPAELIKQGGHRIVDAMHKICNQIWTSKTWPENWTRSLIIPIPKKANSNKCENYRTISLISHPSKVMLQLLLNRLRDQVEAILSEEQAGFRPKRSTIEQIFNVRILNEKHINSQKHIFHNFIDFKKAFDRVWHKGLWKIMELFNIDNHIIQVIAALYDNSESAVLIDNMYGEFFRTTVGVRQGCLLSPILFNIFLEFMMLEALEGHQPTITVGGRAISNLRFADDIDLIAGSEEELQDLTERLNRTSKAYGMEISTQKSKILVCSNNPMPDTHIEIDHQSLEEVTSFTYLGSIITNGTSTTTEVKSRLARCTSANCRLKPLWANRNITLKTKLKLYNTLIVPILLYGCETWVLTKANERKLTAFQFKAYRMILGIHWSEHRTNEYVKTRIMAAAPGQANVLDIVKQRILTWIRKVSLKDNSICKMVFQGRVEGLRNRGRPKTNYNDQVKRWTGKDMRELNIACRNKTEWQNIIKHATEMG